MTLTKEDLQAISELIDEKFDEKIEPINRRLEVLELGQQITHNRLNDLSLDIKVLGRDTKKEIHRLQDAQDTLIKILENNGTLPLAR